MDTNSEYVTLTTWKISAAFWRNFREINKSHDEAYWEISVKYDICVRLTTNKRACIFDPCGSTPSSRAIHLIGFMTVTCLKANIPLKPLSNRKYICTYSQYQPSFWSTVWMHWCLYLLESLSKLPDVGFSSFWFPQLRSMTKRSPLQLSNQLWNIVSAIKWVLKRKLFDCLSRSPVCSRNIMGCFMVA